MRGLLEQLDERGKYQSGTGSGSAGRRCGGPTRPRAAEPPGLRRPVCEQLEVELSERINRAIFDGDAAVNIDQLLGSSAVTTHNWPGQCTPLAAALNSRLAAPLGWHTPRTVTGSETLQQQ